MSRIQFCDIVTAHVTFLLDMSAQFIRLEFV